MRAWLWLKRIVLAVVLIAVALAIAATVGLQLVDTEALKSRIEARVEAATGRALQIDGPLEASLFPWLGFELNGARLANAPGFGEGPFVAVEHAELRVRVLPLLRREVALDTIRLEGLRVNAARDAQGRTNWADLLPADGSAPPPEPPAPEQPGTPAETQRKPLALRIGGLEVRDARLTWRDAVAGRTIVLRDLGLTMNTLRPDRPTPLIMGGRLVIDDRPPLDLHLSTRLSWDRAVPSVTLGSLSIGVTGRGHYLPRSATLELKTDLHVDGAAQTASLERIVLRAFGRATARGAAQVRLGGETPSFTGRLAVEPFDPAALAEAGGLMLPQRADPDTLRRASMAVDFSGTPEALRLEPIELSLDDTEVSGHARAELGDTPTLEFALAANTLDLDRYLPPADTEGSDGDGDGDGDAGQDDPAGDDPIADLPFDALHGVAGQGRVTVGTLRWHGLPMEELRVELGLADGVLSVSRADLSVAGGRIGASGQLDAGDPERPAARIQARIEQVPSQPLLGAFTDSAPITGQLNANAALATAGATLDEWIGGLQGDLAARFSEGAIEGVNIAQRLRMAAARLRGDELAQASEPRRTDFSSLRMSARVSEGVARSDDLDLRTPLLRVGGQGWVDLAERTLDYTARVLVTGTLEGQGGAAMEQLSGAEIPLELSGALASPSIRLALADVLEERARQRLEQEAGEAEQRAREEIEQEVEEAGDRIERELRERFEGVFE